MSAPRQAKATASTPSDDEGGETLSEIAEWPDGESFEHPHVFPDRSINQAFVEEVLPYIDEGEGVLEVSPEEFKEFSVDLYEAVCERPNEYLLAFEYAAQSKGYDEVQLVGSLPDYSGRSPAKRIEDLRAADINKLVSVDAKITHRTEGFPRILVAVFGCPKCGDAVEVPQPMDSDVDDVLPDECECGKVSPKKMSYLKNQSYATDTQLAIAQDMHHATQSPEPTDITAILYRSLVGNIESGEDVTLTAIVRQDGRVARDGELRLQVVGVDHHDVKFSGVEITDEDIEEITSLSESPHVHSHLATSLGPTLVGDQYTLARMAGLLQLFGGVRREIGSEVTRGDIHIAYVGDPGTGKSILSKCINDIAPNGHYQSCQGVSEVGLTASVTHVDRLDTSKWVVEGGAVVQAHGGHLVLDEADKAAADLNSALHETLAQQEVSVSKAGVNTTLRAQCSALLVLNPEEERWVGMWEEADQVGLEESMWSRMDLIIPFRDKPDEELDAEVADSILGRSAGDVPEYVDPDLLTKYVAYARQHFDPVLTEDAHEVLKEAYVNLRGMSSDNRVAIGPRHLEAMRRLSEASARVRLDDEATVEDAELAVQLMESWMWQLMTDHRGRLDADVVGGTGGSSKRERVEVFWEVFEDTIEATGNGVHRDIITEEMVERGYDERNVIQTINGIIGRKDVKNEDSVLFKK